MELDRIKQNDNTSGSDQKNVDQRTRDELLEYEIIKIRHEVKLKEQEIKLKEQNLEARKSMMGYIKWVVGAWLVVMVLVVFFDGIGKIPFYNQCFSTSDAVIITLVTTTTINVLGCLLIVLYNLFPSSLGIPKTN